MTLNRGILTHHPSQRELGMLNRVVIVSDTPDESEVIMVPLWKAALITLGLSAMAGSFGYSIQPDLPIITNTLVLHDCEPREASEGKSQ